MTTRIAEASHSASPVIARILAWAPPPVPANDVGPDRGGPDRGGAGDGRDELLRIALRHFAEHGLAAAARARDQARIAHALGRHEDYLHWLAICRTLDRRMADAAQRQAHG